MNAKRMLLSMVLLAALLAVAIGGGGCNGGDETTTTLATAPSGDSTATTVASTPTASTIPVVLDPLSTFESKDPFRQQALPPATAGSTTTTTGGSGGSTTTTTGGSGGSTTTTTGGSGGTTTTTQPSGVTTPVHSLKVLSIDVANGVPVVTFEVDGVIYEDKKEGDVVSTSWGQIEVVSIDPEQQVVVLLHGSETRTLAVGQEFLK